MHLGKCKKNDMHELVHLQGTIDGLRLAATTSLPCAVQSASEQRHKPILTDSARHADIHFFNVEERNPDVADAQYTLASSRSSCHCHFQCCRHCVILFALPFECSDLHSNQMLSCFLASVIVGHFSRTSFFPIASPSGTLSRDMVIRHFFHVGLAACQRESGCQSCYRHFRSPPPAPLRTPPV